jgi:RHS repeat-associated protein
MVMRVAAQDANGKLLPGYSGLLTFSSSDAGLTYGGGIDGNHQYRMPCSCDNGRPFPVTFSLTGVQTVTVTDEFGHSDQVQVNVASAPSPIPVPTGLAAYSVEWAYGHTVDYYIDNNSGLALTAVETYSTCAGGNPQRNGSGESLANRYTSFSVHIAVAECGYAGSQANDANNVIVTDGSGHEWDLGTTRYYRFSSVPGSSGFTMLDAGDPLAANDVSVVNRTFATTPVPSPDGSGRNFNVAFDGLTLQVGAYSSFRITGYSFPNSPFVTFYSVPYERQSHSVAAGTSDVVLDDIPWACFSFSANGNSGLDVRYVDSGSGRDGRRDFTIGYPPTPPPGMCVSPNDGPTYAPVTSEQSGQNLPFTLDMFSAPLFQAVRQAVGDPVDVFSGSQTADVTDVTLGGLTPSLTVRRVYRSVVAEMLWEGKAGGNTQQLLFGPGWASVFDTNLAFPSSTRVSVRHTDGYYEFDQTTSGAWVASGNTTDALSQITGGWKLTHLDGTGFRFDPTGRLAAIFDANGRELVLTWTSGKLTALTDADSRVGTVTTNTAGEITRIDLPGGRYVAYTYDANGYLHTVRDLAGSVVTYNADTRGRITSVQDSAQHVLLSDVYDSRGRVVAQYDALNHPTFFNYDDIAISGTGFTIPTTTTLTRTSIGPLGAATLSCYNTKGLMIGTIGPMGGIKSWTYDGSGNPIRSVDELGYVSKATFDSHREPLTMTDALGHVTTMTWDAFGHLASTSNSSATTSVTFDPTTHLPTTITNTSGANSQQTAAYTYVTGSNLLQTAVAQGGATSTYHYDAYGYVDSIIDPAGRKTTFVTDPNTGLVTSSVDPLGNATGGVPSDHTTTYTYDGAGRVLTVTDPLGNMAGGNAAAHTTTYTYDGFGRLKTESRASGALTTYNYDLAGHLTSTVVKLTASVNATTAYQYNAAGNLTLVTDPESRGTQTAYDLAGRPISVTDANSKTSTLEYDAKGRLIKTTDPTGVVLQTTYDALDRVTSQVDGANKSTTYTYDPTTGLLTAVTDPLTHTTNYGYDWLGRLTSVTNAENKTSSTTYNTHGFVAMVTNARLKTTSFTYNEVGQLLTVTEPGDAGDLVTTYTYYDDGSLKTRQNARGAVDHYEYNALGQPTKLTDAVGKIWQTFYTDDGYIDHTIDGAGQTTTFGHDLAGRLLTVTPTSPTPAITYTYDNSARVLTEADGNGTTTYGYDPVGRLSSVLRGGRTTGYTYDDASRLKTVAYPASQGTVTYAYDTAGRLSTISDWASRVTTYHYDNASRVSSVDRPGGLTTSYSYDNVNRPLTAVSVRAGNTLLSQAWTYDPDGNIATLTDDTGTASFTYDNLDRLLTASYPASQNYTYTYDAVGNITQAVTPTGTASYTYDLGDRITSNGPAGSPQSGSSTRPPSTNNAGWTNSGNAYTSDNTYATASPAKNQTTSVRVGTFGFDAQIPANATITNVTVSVEWKVDTTSSIATLGSQVYVGGTARGTEFVNSAEPTSDTTQTYTVSGLTRADLLDGTFEVQARASRGNSNTAFTASLDTVSVQVDYTIPGPPAAAPTYDNNGNMTSDGSYGNRTYAYDTLGRLASVTAGGATTTYALDGTGNRWSQATGATTTNFDLDLLRANPTILADGAAKYLAGSPGSGYEAGGTWRNAITDLIGSTILYVDTAGTTSGLTHYDPYGVPRPGSTATTGIGYVGEYRDGTGLVNLRARSYDPVLGRFIGRDTFSGVASAPQTGNRYAYATANPMRYRDPSGHFVQTIIAHPGVLVELVAYLNPLTALILTAEKVLTGHDPATGERVDALNALGDFAFVVSVPVIGKFISKALGALLGRFGDDAVAGADVANAERTATGAFTSDASTATRAQAVIPQGLAGPAEFADFGSRLQSGLRDAGYADAQAAFQGSSVTGTSFRTGLPFDVGRVSDYDVAIGGEGIFSAAEDAGIGLRGGGTRTGPLTSLDLERLGLTSLRADLSELTGRPVNFMIYQSIEDALARSPSILIP